MAFPTARSSSTMATIGPLSGTWQPRATLAEQRISSARLDLINVGAIATCFDYTNVEERNDWLRRAVNLVVRGASCVTGLDIHSTLTTIGSKEPLRPGLRWRGKVGRRE